MKKAVLFAVIAMLILVAACGKTQTAKPLSQRPAVEQPAAVAEAPSESSVVVEDESSGKTAAEALAELEQQMIADGTSGLKTGSTGLPPAPAGVTGKDALTARMRSLYKQSSPVTGGVTADTRQGSISDNLPDDYDNDDSAGE
jgi:hypothetical protein